MGATLLDGVVVERHGMVAAGSLVRQNTRIPSGEVYHLSFSLLEDTKVYIFVYLFFCNNSDHPSPFT